MDLFSQPDADKIDRLKAAGWFCVDLWGQKAWRSPDGRQTTLYTETAIKWLEEAEAAKDAQ